MAAGAVSAGPAQTSRQSSARVSPLTSGRVVTDGQDKRKAGYARDAASGVSRTGGPACTPAASAFAKVVGGGRRPGAGVGGTGVGAGAGTGAGAAGIGAGGGTTRAQPLAARIRPERRRRRRKAASGGFIGLDEAPVRIAVLEVAL